MPFDNLVPVSEEEAQQLDSMLNPVSPEEAAELDDDLYKQNQIPEPTLASEARGIWEHNAKQMVPNITASVRSNLEGYKAAKDTLSQEDGFFGQAMKAVNKYTRYHPSSMFGFLNAVSQPGFTEGMKQIEGAEAFAPDQSVPAPQTIPGQAAGAVVEMAPMIAATVASPMLGAATMYAQMQGSKQRQLESEGKSSTEALTQSSISAGAQLPFEFLANYAGAKVIKALGKGTFPFLKAYVTEVVGEGSTEAIQTVIEKIVDYSYDNPDKSFSSVLTDVLGDASTGEEAWHAAKVGSLAATFFGGGAHVAGVAANKIKGEPDLDAMYEESKRDKALAEGTQPIPAELDNDMPPGMFDPEASTDFEFEGEQQEEQQPEQKKFSDLHQMYNEREGRELDPLDAAKLELNEKWKRYNAEYKNLPDNLRTSEEGQKIHSDAQKAFNAVSAMLNGRDPGPLDQDVSKIVEEMVDELDQEFTPAEAPVVNKTEAGEDFELEDSKTPNVVPHPTAKGRFVVKTDDPIATKKQLMESGVKGISIARKLGGLSIPIDQMQTTEETLYPEVQEERIADEKTQKQTEKITSDIDKRRAESDKKPNGIIRDMIDSQFKLADKKQGDKDMIAALAEDEAQQLGRQQARNVTDADIKRRLGPEQGQEFAAELEADRLNREGIKKASVEADNIINRGAEKAPKQNIAELEKQEAVQEKDAVQKAADEAVAGPDEIQKAKQRGELERAGLVTPEKPKAITVDQAIKQIGQEKEPAVDFTKPVEQKERNYSAMDYQQIKKIAEASGIGIKGEKGGARPKSALIKDIQAREADQKQRLEESKTAHGKTESGILFKTSDKNLEPQQGMEQKDAARHVARTIEGWNNSPKFNVVESQDQLPDAIKKNVPMGKKVLGVYDTQTNTVQIVANNHSDPVKLEATIFHETFRHAGFRHFLGKSYNQFMARAWTNKTVQDEAIRIAKEYKKDVGAGKAWNDLTVDQKKNRIQFTDEAIATLGDDSYIVKTKSGKIEKIFDNKHDADAYARRKKEGRTVDHRAPFEAGFWNRALAKVREWMRKHTPGLYKFIGGGFEPTDAELKTFVYRARQQIVEGGDAFAGFTSASTIDNNLGRPMHHLEGSNVFYSRLQEIVLGKMPDKGAIPASQMLNQIRTWVKKGVIPKPVQTELEWVGLEDWLSGLAKRGEKVSAYGKNGDGQYSVNDFLNANAIKIREEMLVPDSGKTDTQYGGLIARPSVGENVRVATKGYGDNTRSSYRELIFVWPEPHSEIIPGHFDYFEGPNIAHVRFDTRDIDGKKILFINEMQSDWAAAAANEEKERKDRIESAKSLKYEKRKRLEMYDNASITAKQTENLDIYMQLLEKRIKEGSVIDFAEEARSYFKTYLKEVVEPNSMYDEDAKRHAASVLQYFDDVVGAEEMKHILDTLREPNREVYNNFLEGFSSNDVFQDNNDLLSWLSRYRKIVHEYSTSSKEILDDFREKNINDFILKYIGEPVVKDEKTDLENALPFKNNWQEMIMKRMIHYAAQHGHDSIMWPRNPELIAQIEGWPSVPHNEESIGYGVVKSYTERLPKKIKKYVSKYGSELKESDIGEGQNIPLTNAKTIPKSNRGVYEFEMTPELIDSALDGRQFLFKVAEEDSQYDSPEHAGAVAGGVLDSLGNPQDERLKEGLQRLFQDKMIRLKKYTASIRDKGKALPEYADAYLAEELFHGKTGSDLDWVEQKHAKPLIERMVKLGIEPAELDLFLYARHAPERNAHIASINPKHNDPDMPGSGIKDQEATDVMNEFAKEGKIEKLMDLAQMVDRINRTSLDIMLKGELITQEAYDIMANKYKYYVPLKGGDVMRESVFGATGKGYSVSTNGLKRAFGRQTLATNMIASSMSGLTDTIIRVRKNEVGKAFLRLVEENPSDAWSVKKYDLKQKFDPKAGEVKTVKVPVSPNDPNILTVFEDGQRKFIEMKDPLLARAMKNVGVSKMNVLTSALAKMNRYLAAVNTARNPEFLVTNFIRDIQTAGINLSAEQTKRMAGKMAMHTPGAIRAAHAGFKGKKIKDASWKNYFDEYRQSGGSIGFFGLETVGEKAESINKMYKRASETGAVGATKKFFRGAADMIDNANKAVENATRLAAFRAMREAGYSKAQSATVAKNLTVNFNRKGELGHVLNAMYLFYNAGIQGPARMLRAMTSKRGKQIAAGMVAGGFLQAVYNTAVAGDDDDGENYYDKLPDHIRERNIVFMGEGGKAHTIPMPYGYNVFWAMGDRLHDIIVKGKVKEGLSDLFKTTLNAFNPMGSDSSFLRMMSPTAGDTILDLTMNENFAGYKIRPEQPAFGPEKPRSQLYFSSANPALVKFAKWLNSIGNPGDPETRSGLIDVSPEDMEYIIGEATGGLGKFVSRITNIGLDAMDGEIDKTEIHQIPFARVFSKEVPKYQTSETFNNAAKHMQLIKKERSERRDIPEDEKKLIGLLGVYKSTNKVLQNLYEAKSLAKKRGQAKRVEYLDKIIRRRQKEFLHKYNKATGEI